MPAGDVDPDIQKKLRDLHNQQGDTVAVAEIVDVVDSIMSTMKGDLTATDLEIYTELEALGRYIHEAKDDIAALRPDEVKDDYLPTASDELDAIVEATEIATNSIMDATEVVESVMGDVSSEVSDKLMEATSNIYEACGFQDITGQRITKVVKALKDIEEKIDGLVAAFGSEIDKVKKAQTVQKDDAAEQPVTDEDLLHGPQMAEEANSQDEIDALLASFD
jgi:chemotaxis protein CheZ